MRYWNLIKENPKRIYYYIKGHLLWFLVGKYVLRYMVKSIECGDCFKAGFCKHCGCEVNPLFLSGIKCGKDVG